ncbi:acyltransferase family protein [Nocardioides sp.]|uniref:acyltransferase family protein n=1 Tax=Nocardioides sp. TaxID=35761 RepID=UPI00273612C0|nr:acyltransferase family protein [Nocardioides sp.]MDP3894214.1 acyltransferase family protein [Nocardioides sp.]
MTWTYRPELDGLRSFAVVIIIFFHAGVAGAQNSFIALDLFFVLSGFLVTHVVLSEIDAKGSLRLSRYYARRVRRLLPAAVVAIVVTSIVFLLIASQPERLALVRQAQAALLYLANWQFIAESHDYFAADMTKSPFMHFWSLSIEEQYYIFFPLLILAVHRFAPGRGRVLLGVLGVLIALSVASQVITAQVDPTRAYYATDARLFQLLAGAALAVAVREFVRADGTLAGIAWPTVGRVLAAGGLLGYLVFGTALVPMTVSSRNLVATVVAGALVVGLYLAPGSLAARAFSRPLPVYLGKISYGTYLWHWPTILVLQQFLTVRPLVVALMAGAIATAFAALSNEVLETPIRRARVLDGVHWRTVGVGVTVSVLAALFVVGPILNSPRSPAVTAAGAERLAEVQDTVTSGELNRKLKRPVPDVDLERTARDKGRGGGHCSPTDVDACLRVDNDGPHVVLVGDSQARAMAPAFERLAQEKGFKLSSSLVMSCPWQAGLYNVERLDSCRENRDGFYEETLAAMEADVVVLVNLARSDESWEGMLVDRRGRGGDLHQMQLEATTRTVELIHSAGARAVIVNSLLGTEGWDRVGFDPLDCLARAEVQGDCVVTPPQDRPIVDSYYETLATSSQDTATVDLNPVVCPEAPFCRPVQHGRAVWRNENHLGTPFLTTVREQIWERIEETGLVPPT